MEDDDQRTAVDGTPASDIMNEGDLIGVEVGGYLIDGVLGRGGMGIVYAATHPMIGKRAAIKVLKPSLSNNPATVERFVQEARAVNQIGHPNIVDIFAFGALPDGRSYLVMDLLEGESLRKRVKRGPLTISEATHVIDEVASALTAAHDKGFIHRDLKPDNVYLVAHAGRTECKLLDFGLAKLTSNMGTPRAYRTATGAQLGTPDYMSPEQLQGAGKVDARTDIYALGVMAFEIVVGERPRRYSDGTFELDGKTVAEAITDKANPPKELVQLIEAMLAYDPKRRPSLQAVQAVLKRVRTAVPSTSVIGLPVNLPRVYPSLATPPTGAPTVDEGPRSFQVVQSLQQPMSPALRPPEVSPMGTPAITQTPASSAGLAVASSHGGTKLGHQPYGVRPSAPQLAAKPVERSESRVWLIVGLVLLVVSSAALVFVLAR